ncbi:MAG: FecR family protein [Verrucomicrobiales bacterium]|nr:FecR family protein [Verrucomicrobiales bacterium]
MKEAESLIAGWLDDSLDGAEQSQFESWLREHPENLDQLVEASIRDQQLREAVQIFESRSSAGFSQKRRRYLPLLAAAAALVFSLVATFWLSTGSTRSSGLAEVIAAEEVLLGNRKETFSAGMKFAMGPVSLKSGRLELMLDSGVHLKMMAPLEAELIDDMHLRLKSGRLNANVGERGKGFTVYTEAGDVIDLGTEFGIEVDEDGESRVAVFSGKVEVHPREKGKRQSNGKGRITLNEGQAARFSVLAGLRRWDKVALAAKAAGISSDRYDGVVREVRDNLGDSELYPFYGIVRGGMKEGALAYTDKPNPRWHAAEGERFPEWLEGADQIRTYHQFRYRRYYRLNLELVEPAVVYVFQDSRVEPPVWLRQGFTDTGTQLRVGPWHPNMAGEPGVEVEADGPWLNVNVWSREVAPGLLELGSPLTRDADEHVSMYGLAVKPLHK